MSAKHMIHDAEIYDDDAYKSTLNNDQNVVVFSKGVSILRTNSEKGDTSLISKTSDKKDIQYNAFLELKKTVDDNGLDMLEECDFFSFKRFIKKYEMKT